MVVEVRGWLCGGVIGKEGFGSEEEGGCCDKGEGWMWWGGEAEGLRTRRSEFDAEGEGGVLR